MSSTILTDWQPRHASLFGKHTLNLGHSLADSADFTDDALARLIEATPRGDYHVNTMDPTTHDPRTRREGEIAGLSGREVIEAIRAGRIWLNLRNPGSHVPAYQRLLDDIYAAFEARVPGLATYKQRMTILISSPKVQVYYHADVPGQSLWQVRGKKRVYLYPNTAPFLPEPAMEDIVLGRAHEISLDYQPWFDEHADVITLEPGRMLHWPLNCPHRIVNEDCLNVSVTTEHWTNELRNHYAVTYANGLLRRHLGMTQLSRATSGLGFQAKLALAAAHKLSGVQRNARAGFRIDFKVDPRAPLGFIDRPAYELRK